MLHHVPDDSQDGDEARLPRRSENLDLFFVRQELKHPQPYKRLLLLRRRSVGSPAEKFRTTRSLFQTSELDFHLPPLTRYLCHLAVRQQFVFQDVGD